MKIINQTQLDQLSAEAAQNPRLRKNLNIHPSDDFCCHRLFNAVEPGSYIPPHRHIDPVKDETFVIIRGRLGVIMFDDGGRIVKTALLSEGGEVVAADIPHGAFHAAVSLETGTIFFEAKAGPYRPLTDQEKAHWAPQDGTPEAAVYREFLESLF
jgi:cupin fold WbuC family metalloprotein